MLYKNLNQCELLRNQFAENACFIENIHATSIFLQIYKKNELKCFTAYGQCPLKFLG